MDYDPTAQKVAEAGFSLAKSMKAEVLLLHVLSDVVYYSSLEYSPIMGFSSIDMGPVLLMDMDNLKKAAHLYLDKVKKHLGDDTIQTMVLEGDDKADIILQAAKESRTEIIAMGSHGRKWLDKILMGSVTEKVLNHSTLPVLIIPTKKQK